MQIKTLSVFAFLSVSIFSFNLNGQTWYWTKQADSSNSQTASQVAVDRKNNPLYTGYCSGTRMAFGHIGINITGTQTDFLAKYDPNGNPLWARNGKALNASAAIYGMSVASDRNNDVLEVGYFDDSVAFGSYHLKSNSSYNSYVVKYDANGNVLWAASPIATKSGNTSNQAYTVACDRANNILVIGYFVDTAVFGTDTLLASNTTNMFLVKYSSAGTVLWARTATLGAGAYCYGLSGASDDSDNIYISGNISGLVTFGSTPALNGNASVYLAKYDSNGNAKWSVNTTATPGSEYPTPVVVDRSNNVYVGAQFTNASITFGPSTVTDGAAPSCSNALLAKYNRNGTPLWAACADFISRNEVCVIIESSAATDHCNNVYWSGLCSDSFGVGRVKVTVPNAWQNQSTPFAYVIQLDSNGNAIAGAALANQNGNSFSNYMAVDSLSKALFASELVSPATLVVGNDTVHQYLNTSTAFLSKFAVIPAIHNSKNNDSICFGDSAILSVFSVAGTTYIWSTGSTRDTIIVKPPRTTTYYVIINNGCIIDTSYMKVTVSPLPTAKITGGDSICKGQTAILTGTGGGTYLWSNGKTTSTISVSPASNTTYTLTVNKGGCSKDTTFALKVLPLPVAIAKATPDSVCSGDSILLSGSGGTFYKWSNGKTSSNIWVNPLVNTTYTLHVTSSSGCSDSINLKVYIIPPITASVSPLTDSICPKQTVTLTATGSGGAVTYQWNNGATTASIQVTDSVTTKYVVTVSGRCNTVKDSVTVVVVPFAKPVIRGSASKCQGVKDTLIVSGGTSYLWSNGLTTDTCITGKIEGDSTLIVIAYNSLGCPSSTSFNVSISPAPGITILDTNTCFNNPVVLYGSATGNGPFTYKWSPGNETNSSIIVPDTGQTYTLLVSNGCISTKTIHLAPVVPALAACCDKLILQGDDTTIVAHGNSIKSYSWSPAVNCLNPSCDSVKVTPTVTTTYTVVGTDSLGCQNEQVVTILVEIPCFNLTIPNVFTPTESGLIGVDNVFYIKTKNINSWSIQIYDRWGKEMFNSTNPDQYWDGTTESGAQASAGVYYYIITGTCQNSTYKKDGFVQLIR